MSVIFEAFSKIMGGNVSYGHFCTVIGEIMLVPKTENFTAIIGGTFDPVITLFASLPLSFWRGNWTSGVQYPINAAVKASNGNMYQATSSNVNIDPVTDAGVHWLPLSPFDLTGYSATLQIGSSGGTPSLALTDTGGLVLGGAAGTIAVNATPVQTATFVSGKQHFYLKLTKAGIVTFPMKGSVTFVTP